MIAGKMILMSDYNLILFLEFITVNGFNVLEMQSPFMEITKNTFMTSSPNSLMTTGLFIGISTMNLEILVITKSVLVYLKMCLLTQDK